MFINFTGSPRYEELLVIMSQFTLFCYPHITILMLYINEL